MKIPTIFILAVPLIFLGACTTSYLSYNFDRNTILTANLGAEMTNETEEVHYGDEVIGTVERTLIYFGVQGNMVKLYYRESINNTPPALVSQLLTYDISKTNTISFKGTAIRVLEATNSKITFVVLESPAFKYKSGSKIEDVR